MVKKNIILRKRRAPVQINKSNGRSFTSRWERISRKQLPTNIKVARSTAIGPRRQRKRKSIPKITLKKNKQMGWEIRRDKRNAAADNNIDFQVGSGMGCTLLKTGVSLGSQAINSTIEKKPIDKGINSIPNIFRFGRRKVKNKKLKKILKSDIADLLVDETQKKVKPKYDDLFLAEKK